MNEEGVCRTAPATPGLLKNLVEGQSPPQELEGAESSSLTKGK